MPHIVLLVFLAMLVVHSVEATVAVSPRSPRIIICILFMYYVISGDTYYFQARSIHYAYTCVQLYVNVWMYSCIRMYVCMYVCMYVYRKHTDVLVCVRMHAMMEATARNGLNYSSDALWIIRRAMHCGSYTVRCIVDHTPCILANMTQGHERKEPPEERGVLEQATRSAV